MSLNFASFKPQKTANVRASVAGVARGQNFKMKYRKFLSKKDGKESDETLFEIAKDKFAELGLDNLGFIEIKDPESGKSYLATVDNDNATMLKRTNKLAADAEKGKKFKSTILEDSLRKDGIIVDDATTYGKSQFLDLVEVAKDVQIGDIKAYGVYEIVKGAESASDDVETEGGAEGTETQETPVQEEIPVQGAGTTSDDDF